MEKSLYAIILAGGSGTRFWPLSRRKRPKQVLSITGNHSLVRETVERVEGLVPRERILIVTNRHQVKTIAEQLPELDESNYLLEPMPRNTAPCIGLAAMHIQRQDPDAVMLVLPSDHLIKDVPKFQKVIRQGVSIALERDALVTIGIPPTRPETGYGYIQFDGTENNLPEGVRLVKTFAEKPNLPTAERFVQSGDFYWNSGLFIWRADRILAEMEEHLTIVYHHLRLIDDAWGQKSYPRILSSRYSRIRPISIDYGVMEVTNAPIYMLDGAFGWSDVGSWDELYRISEKGREGNVSVGESALLEAHRNYIYSPGRLTAVIGIDDILVVNTPSATLICPLNRAQEVKTMVDKLYKEGREEYL
ncbi:MAG: mannose-1-phosphate guanylyltransferase [Calditrichota bacterium]